MTGDLLLGACTIESNGWTNAFNMSEACLSSLEADDDRQFYHHMQLSSSSSSSSSISASPAQYPQCSPYSVPRRLTDDPIDFVGSYNALSDTVCLSSSPDSGTESTTPPLNCIDLAGLDEFLNTNSTSNDLIYSRLDSCSSSRSVTNSAVDLATEFLNFSQNPSPTRSSCSDLISSPIVDAGSSSDTKISSCLIDLACDLTDFTVASVRQADTAAISSDISNGTTRFQCDLCGKCFNRKYLFDRHVQSHSGTKPYICAVCNRTFSQKSNLKQHMSVHKAWPKGLSRCVPVIGNDGRPESHAHACPYCTCLFADFNKLKSHLPQHREKQCYRCPLCPSLFEQLEQLVQHQKSMHPVQMTGSVQSSSLAHLSISAPAVSASKSLYQCTDCGEWFNSSSELQMHASSSDHRPFTCDLCNKRFQNRRSLNRHFRLHTNASFACDRCPKQFKTLPYLKSHQQTHDRQRSRSCTQCGASFSRSDQLHRHMLIHDTEKRFRCPFSESVGCQRQFQRSDKLKQHLATHMKTPASPQPTSSNSSLVCPHCGRSYVNRKTYFLHLRAHSLDQQRLRESFDNVRETKLLPKTIQAISELEGDSVVSDLQLEVTVGGDISTESAAEAEQNDSIPWWGCTACAKLFASASELYEHGCVPETCKSTSAPSGDTRNTLHLALNAINDSIDTDPPFVDLLPNQSQVPDIYSRHNATKSSLFDTASSIHNHS